MRNKKYFGGVSPYRQTDDKGSSNTEPIGSKELVYSSIILVGGFCSWACTCESAARA